MYIKTVVGEGYLNVNKSQSVKPFNISEKLQLIAKYAIDMLDI